MYLFTVIMVIPTKNCEFYKIHNDDDLLSQFIREQNLAQHLCHYGSLIVDGSRKKKLKDDTIRCINRECRN